MRDILTKKVPEVEARSNMPMYDPSIYYPNLFDRKDVYKAHDVVKVSYNYSLTVRYVLHIAYPNPDTDW